MLKLDKDMEKEGAVDPTLHRSDPRCVAGVAGLAREAAALPHRVTCAQCLRYTKTKDMCLYSVRLPQPTPDAMPLFFSAAETSP